MLKSISKNPYRVLGVYANSPKREQVANKTKMAAFLRVGKSMPFPLDLKGVLPEINRTQELIDKADSELSLAEGQMKAAQFWFIKNSPLDDIAFNHLFQGNIEEAISVWGKQTNVSSLQNRFVCSLIKGNYQDAIDKYSSVLYSSYKDSFCSLIGENISKEENELIEVVLSNLQEEGSVENLYNSVANPTWKAALGAKVVEPYIKRAETAIAICKASKGKLPWQRKVAGYNLVTDSKVVLPKLKALLSSTNAQFRSISDKYAQEILQCGIDYYNALEAEEAIEDAMKLNAYALSIAVGAVAKQRCQENADILNKIAKQLPPIAILSNIKNVVNTIERISSPSYSVDNKLWVITYKSKNIEKAKDLINKTKSDLSEMKRKVGVMNEWYLNLSIRVCSTALSWVIDDVNKAQDNLGANLRFSASTGLSAGTHLDTCKGILDNAESVMNMIARMDSNSDFRSHFNEQRKALNGIVAQVDSMISTINARANSYSSSSYSSPRRSAAYSSSSSSSSDNDDFVGCLVWAAAAAIIFLSVISC